MRTLAVPLLSIALLGAPGLRGVAAAQTPVTRVVYEQCRADGTWNVSCFIGLAVDGSDAVIANGVGPKWSPDGSKIAFTGTTDPSVPYSPWDSIPEVLVLNLADGSITNLTDPATGWGPVWSPDGGRIAFLSYRDGPLELYVMEASGANPTRVTHDVGFTGAFAWSPDGGRFAFASEQDGEPELYVTVEATANAYTFGHTKPFVVLTSNATRELSEAVKRRCLFLHLDYPTAERERAIVTGQVPDLDDRIAGQLVATIGLMVMLIGVQGIGKDTI